MTTETRQKCRNFNARKQSWICDWLHPRLEEKALSASLRVVTWYL